MNLPRCLRPLTTPLSKLKSKQQWLDFYVARALQKVRAHPTYHAEFCEYKGLFGSGYAPWSIENVFKHGNLQTLFTALSDPCTAMLGGSRGVIRKLFEHGACNYAFLWST